MPDNGTILPDTPHDTGGTQEIPGTELHIRALASPFKKTQLIQQDDGSLLIKGVPMLAAGTWTDSAVGTPLYYPEKTLSDYAQNWHDDTGWSRHLGGVPRDITEKVAHAENLRYENGAVTADVVVHGATQKSRDTIELVKRKLISFVSVEHGGEEKWNPQTRQMEAATLDFYGFAFVNKGACKLCRIQEAPKPAEPVKESGEHDKSAKEVDQMDTKELETKIEALTKELSETKAAIPKPVEAPTKELEELKAMVAAQDAKIKELEKQPAPPATVQAPAQTKELGTVETIAVWDKKAGTVRGV